MPVEAIAAGSPVIAFKKGADSLDSMTEQTATFYSHQSADGLTEGIRNFEATQSRFDEAILRKQAALFSEAAFLKGFEQLLQTALTQRNRAPAAIMRFINP